MCKRSELEIENNGVGDLDWVVLVSSSFFKVDNDWGRP